MLEASGNGTRVSPCIPAPVGLGGTGASQVAAHSPRTLPDPRAATRLAQRWGAAGSLKKVSWEGRGAGTRTRQSHPLYPPPFRMHACTLAPGERTPGLHKAGRRTQKGARAFQRRVSVAGGASEAESPLPPSSRCSLPSPRPHAAEERTLIKASALCLSPSRFSHSLKMLPSDTPPHTQL